MVSFIERLLSVLFDTILIKSKSNFDLGLSVEMVITCFHHQNRLKHQTDFVSENKTKYPKVQTIMTKTCEKC